MALRSLGRNLIMIARNSLPTQQNNGVRYCLKIQEHQVNWGAQTYYEFIDYDTVPDITEPSYTVDLAEAQLDGIVDGTINLVTLCALEKVYCHTTVCLINTYNLLFKPKFGMFLWGYMFCSCSKSEMVLKFSRNSS